MKNTLRFHLRARGLLMYLMRSASSLRPPENPASPVAAAEPGCLPPAWALRNCRAGSGLVCTEGGWALSGGVALPSLDGVSGAVSSGAGAGAGRSSGHSHTRGCRPPGSRGAERGQALRSSPGAPTAPSRRRESPRERVGGSGIGSGAARQGGSGGRRQEGIKTPASLWPGVFCLSSLLAAGTELRASAPSPGGSESALPAPAGERSGAAAALSASVNFPQRRRSGAWGAGAGGRAGIALPGHEAAAGSSR